jgi:hypothetical protein
MVTLASKKGWEIKHLDMKTTFLHGDLKEEIFMLQPKEFIEPRKEHKVCLFLKVFYGLKQTLRAWYAKIDTFKCTLGLTENESDHNLYFLVEGGHYVILILYADDLFPIGNDTKRLNILEKKLTKQYEMTNVGFMNLYVGIEFIYFEDGILLVQRN